MLKAAARLDCAISFGGSTNQSAGGRTYFSRENYGVSSCVSRSPFIALILTALVLLALFLIGVAEFVAKPGTLPHDIAAHVSIWAQMGDFSSGIIDTRRVAFDLSLVAFSLFATEKVVDQWRWE